MAHLCATEGCGTRILPEAMYCFAHQHVLDLLVGKRTDNAVPLPYIPPKTGLDSIMMPDEFVGISAAGVLVNAPQTMADKYPKYYKAIPASWKVIDVYGVCKLFPVADDTGCIHHAVKKLLVPGTRTGGKSFRDDIKEARDTLTRYLELTEPE